MANTDFERILVTGGSGFIGRAVVSSLVAQGVRPLVADLGVQDTGTGGAFEIARIDLTDKSAVAALIADYRPELVIHLVGANFRNDPDGKRSDRLNFEAAAFLLERLAECGGAKALLMGTAAEYGDSPTPFREDMTARPISHYARSKSKAAQFALDLGTGGDIDVTVLRLFTVYGPGQPANMFLSQLVRQAILNEQFNMSDGNQKRDFVYVDDVVAAILAASGSKLASGRIINIGTGRALALRDAAKYVWEKCEADPANLGIGAVGKVSDDGLDTLADVSLAANLLDWRPVVSFEQGIKNMIAAERDSLDSKIRTK